MTSYHGETKIVEKLGQVENTIRMATTTIVFILIVMLTWVANEVIQLQELQSVDAIEVVEDETSTLP